MTDFYIVNFVNYFRTRNTRIGYVINGFPYPYNAVIASTRIRAYDVIRFFNGDENYLVELFNPLANYDALVFQKKFDEKALSLAKKRKIKGCKIVLDINVNYFDSRSRYISPEQFANIMEFTSITDTIVASSTFLGKVIKSKFPDKPLFVIEESISGSYFKRKKVTFNDVRTLIWVGYAIKANEILSISDALLKLYRENKFKIILVCEKNPSLTIGRIPINFVKYEHTNIVDLLMQGDIFIAPRRLNDSYNLSHSFTKIGIAMAVGLPVVASPVPSYLGSPALICDELSDWQRELNRLLNENDLLYSLSIQGRLFTKENFSAPVIKRKYDDLFKFCIS